MAEWSCSGTSPHGLVGQSAEVMVSTSRGPFPEFIMDSAEGRLYRAESDAHATEAVLRPLADTETRVRLGANAREGILSSHATSLAMRALAQALQAGVASRPVSCRHLPPTG